MPDEANPANYPAVDSFDAWFLCIYGATMLSVQSLEQSISLLYATANVDPHRTSNASVKRQIKQATEKQWSAFRLQTAGMKLNDRKRGIKPHIDADLYAQLDAFFKPQGPRNRLAHRYLIERMMTVHRGGKAELVAETATLLKWHMEADALVKRVMEREQEIRATWPEPVDVPPEYIAWTEDLAHFVLQNEVRPEVLDAIQNPPQRP